MLLASSLRELYFLSHVSSRHPNTFKTLQQPVTINEFIISIHIYTYYYSLRVLWFRFQLLTYSLHTVVFVGMGNICQSLFINILMIKFISQKCGHCGIVRRLPHFHVFCGHSYRSRALIFLFFRCSGRL